MKKMSRLITAAFLATLMLTGCVFTPAPEYGEEIAPPLPAVVEFDTGPYYFYRDYHYRYDQDRWHYARDVNGPWRELPRSHWPREVRYRDGERGRAGGGEFRHEQEREMRR